MLKRLSEKCISKIAAGQIIISPSAALKELVENSIDAEANKITILINTSLNFKVKDNGTGIPFNQLPLTVERFTTSKISQADDLKNLKTFGFRGEALHAISLFSRLEIKSKHYTEEIGGKLTVSGGNFLECKPIPFDNGTSIEIKNLFFNAPLRRKSIKSSERNRLIELSKVYALSHENISFKINENIFPASSLAERVKRVTGKTYKIVNGENFILFLNEEIGNKNSKRIFLNRRPVNIKEIENLFKNLGFEGYILFLKLPPSKFDINISPLKEKVKIENTESIINNLKGKLNKKYLFFPYLKENERKNTLNEEVSVGYIRYIGSDETVIIAEDGNYYYFFDKHLVHERLNYEILIEKLYKGEIEKIPLSKPIEVKNNIKTLKLLGITINGTKNGYFITEIPEIFTIKDIMKIVSGENFERIATIACKNAIKSGTYSDKEDEKKLFYKFLKCREINNCPHGRPIFYRIKKRDILKKLKRI